MKPFLILDSKFFFPIVFVLKYKQCLYVLVACVYCAEANDMQSCSFLASCSLLKPAPTLLLWQSATLCVILLCAVDFQ